MTEERKKELTQLAHDIADVFCEADYATWGKKLKKAFPKEPKLIDGTLYKCRLKRTNDQGFFYRQFREQGNAMCDIYGDVCGKAGDYEILAIMESRPL